MTILYRYFIGTYNVNNLKAKEDRQTDEIKTDCLVFQSIKHRK